MKFSKRASFLVRVLAVGVALAVPLSYSISDAEARARGGGSRGSKTFQAPPSTNTAPGAAQPMQRSMAQPGSPAAGAATKAAPGRGMMGGMLGGLAAGFLGAGLFGMLFGGGFMSGLGSFAGILGMIIQIALVVIVARFAINWWRRRNAPAGASASNYSAAPQQAPDMNNGPQTNARSALGGLGGGAAAGGFGGMFGGGAQAQTTPIEIAPEDYENFERILSEVQTAWSKEDVEALHKLATPEMVSYFAADLKENADRGVVNTVANVKLLQGDLAEAWREQQEEYATVALRFGFVEKTIEKATGKIVDGSDAPTEATEIWTFVRRPGTSWELSAIQNV